MKFIYTKKHVEHNPTYEIYDGVYEPYAEKADRIESIVEVLRENGIKNFHAPLSFPKKHLYAIHQKEYVYFLEKRAAALSNDAVLYPSYFIMDTYTPIVHKTFSAAKTAVDVCLTGAHFLLQGENIVYALSRPPGHHAEGKTMGGYCYFNNAAIAANFLSNHGKVAIFDIDFHHGNGTQNIFYDRADVLYVSLHADPHKKFPYNSGFSTETGRGKGKGYNRNYPLPLGTTNDQYLPVLQKALKNIRDFQPKFLIISAGFDTYEKDPIGGFKLTIPFYKIIGGKIKSLNYPTLIVQEGGYHVENLGELVWSFLQGISMHKDF